MFSKKYSCLCRCLMAIIPYLNQNYNVTQKMKKGSQAVTNRRQQHVKIAPFSTQKSDHQNLSYLILTQDQIQIIHRNLTIRLQFLLKKVNQTCFVTLPEDDPILKQLEELNVQAKNNQFADIEKGILLVEGKRLLNLAIEEKIKVEKKKLRKKEQFEDCMFRYNKIKKFNYRQLIEQKIKQNIYISPAYPLGQGFQQSQYHYTNQSQFHKSRLQQCQYFETVKEVNRIYMKNYKSYNIKQKKQISQIGFTFVLILCLVPFILGVFLYDSNQVQYLIGYVIALLIVMIFILSILGIKQFVNKPNNNNQFEQTQQDVKKYFKEINEKNSKQGKKFIWSFQQKLMYLQVKFKEQ